MTSCDIIDWTDTDGTLLLQATDRGVGRGISGRGLPPIVLREETVPQQPGARLRYVNHAPRDVGVPWYIYTEGGADAAALTADLHGLLRTYLPRFDPTRGDGVLRSTLSDGTERSLTCRYVSGFEGIEAPPERGLSAGEHIAHQLGTLVFHADDPYWYGPTITQVFTSGDRPSFLPIPNPTTGSFITLVGTGVFAEVTVTNPGDVDAQPVWTITGPGDTISLERTDTGQSLEFDSGLVLADGETMTIDTRRFVMTAELADGTNLYPYLDGEPDFWWLGRGDTPVRVFMDGATAASSIELTFRPPYLTGW